MDRREQLKQQFGEPLLKLYGTNAIVHACLRPYVNDNHPTSFEECLKAAVLALAEQNANLLEEIMIARQRQR